MERQLEWSDIFQRKHFILVIICSSDRASSLLRRVLLNHFKPSTVQGCVVLVRSLDLSLIFSFSAQLIDIKRFEQDARYLCGWEFQWRRRKTWIGNLENWGMVSYLCRRLCCFCLGYISQNLIFFVCLIFLSDSSLSLPKIFIMCLSFLAERFLARLLN